MSLKHDLQFAVDVARGAGRIVMDHFGRVERWTKTHAAASAEAVTQADRDSQRFIVEQLRKRFPNDGVIGEEDESGLGITCEAPRPDGRVWVIDPVDGTNNFIAGLQTFAVCIGLLEAGRPIMGVVLDVCRDQAYCAAAGEGAWCGARRLAALGTPLSDASMIMMTSSMVGADERVPPFFTHWLVKTNWKIRMIGSAALEAIQVAAGVAHGAVTISGKLWDIVAAAAVAQEAGAVLTDLHGGGIFPYEIKGYVGAKVPFLVAAPSAHAALLAHIMRG